MQASCEVLRRESLRQVPIAANTAGQPDTVCGQCVRSARASQPATARQCTQGFEVKGRTACVAAAASARGSATRDGSGLLRRSFSLVILPRCISGPADSRSTCALNTRSLHLPSMRLFLHAGRSPSSGDPDQLPGTWSSADSMPSPLYTCCPRTVCATFLHFPLVNISHGTSPKKASCRGGNCLPAKTCGSCRRPSYGRARARCPSALARARGIATAALPRALL